LHGFKAESVIAETKGKFSARNNIYQELVSLKNCDANDVTGGP
jgi:glutathionylspermidine synthase